MSPPTDIAKILSARDDLQEYGDNARLLLALELRFQIEDIDTVAANSLVDGSGDCKCDLIFVDKDSGVAVIAQGYESKNSSKPAAKSDKASGLSTAAGWLISRDIPDIPQHLRSATIELRDALKNGYVTQLQLWYVHNLPESKNVATELVTVENTVHSLITKHFPNSSIEVKAQEIGTSVLFGWYESLKTPILVNDSIRVESQKGYEIQGENWEAYVTAVPASWLRELHLKHKDLLFSANLRGYLGSKRSTSNINNAIKDTADKKPGYFWVFNNGITGVVHDYSIKKNGLELRGLSIVNGAQTTGAIGALKDNPKPEALVQARFVKCSNAKTIDDIIKFNNSQNPVEPADFRSNDPIQKRLRKEFTEVNGWQYSGGRRGGHEDIIRRKPNLIPSNTAAQALAAFHDSPVVAYNEKSRIWLSDELYSRYFNDDTHADHIVFAYSLLKAVQHRKQILMKKVRAGGALKDIEKKQLEFLQKRGATFLLTAAISGCLETVIDKAIPNKFRLTFEKNITPEIAQTIWEPIIDATIPQCGELSPAISGALNNSDEAQMAVNKFKGLIESIKSPLSAQFTQFSSKVRIRS
jgi:hypothetical protein